MNTDLIRTTPIGTSIYCWLSQADTEFNPNGVYHVEVQFNKEEVQEDKTAVNRAIAKMVAEHHKSHPNQTGQIKRAPLPYKENGEKITFKFKSKFKPRLWDKEQKEIGSDISVWKGSTMKVRYKLNPYNQNIGVGCTLYIQDVQIKDLIKASGGDNGACPFPKIEGSALPAREEKAVY